MKKILLMLTIIISTFSMAKGKTTIGAGLGYTGLINSGKGYVNLNANHLVPVYSKNKFSILLGGGLDLSMNFPIIDNVHKNYVFNVDIFPYVTAQLGYEVASETRLRLGGKAGIGPKIRFGKIGNNKLFEHDGIIPVGGVLGVDYKHVSFDLEGKALIYFLKPDPVRTFSIGLNVGYTF
ncbi:hypothetical protein [Oceanivirga salmonicida]|uniref:hypothetical protein n=1 Tax=Oceanivirga salmonicida TaxID=1769291 RepID=UPI0012E27B3A|nr:hypothetical protein [Oceanivirga salmonicida]